MIRSPNVNTNQPSGFNPGWMIRFPCKYQQTTVSTLVSIWRVRTDVVPRKSRAGGYWGPLEPDPRAQAHGYHWPALYQQKGGKVRALEKPGVFFLTKNAPTRRSGYLEWEVCSYSSFISGGACPWLYRQTDQGKVREKAQPEMGAFALVTLWLWVYIFWHRLVWLMTHLNFPIDF